jgi:hypothetical protein
MVAEVPSQIYSDRELPGPTKDRIYSPLIFQFAGFGPLMTLDQLATIVLLDFSTRIKNAETPSLQACTAYRLPENRYFPARFFDGSQIPSTSSP